MVPTSSIWLYTQVPLNVSTNKSLVDSHLGSSRAGMGLPITAAMAFHSNMIQPADHTLYDDQPNASRSLASLPIPHGIYLRTSLHTHVTAGTSASRACRRVRACTVTRLDNVVGLSVSSTARSLVKLAQEREIGKESTMAFVRDPSQHSPGVISRNHRKPISGWPDGELNLVLPNASQVRYHCTTSLSMKRERQDGMKDSICLKSYNLDPWYCAAPGLSWDAMQNFTCCKIHVKANNKYLDDHDKNKESNYLMYLVVGGRIIEPVPRGWPVVVGHLATLQQVTVKTAAWCEDELNHMRASNSHHGAE
ncbi:hypothetical protein PR048_032799 [Dryococelus australis]|uniref:Uncharacterized protein n=1 Tax=Dryococelus australis TaxID=614101 RepID=A0ABQ9G668_9NEOP|nr:hypothetical protein PR048_032799 [Dryococelus australis]